MSEEGSGSAGGPPPQDHAADTQDAAPEVKPEVAAALNLKVKSQDGSIVHFKAKPHTQFRKLMTAYCERRSHNVNDVVFIFDGQRLRPEQTPEEVGMEDHDEIDVMIHQVGGQALAC